MEIFYFLPDCFISFQFYKFLILSNIGNFTISTIQSSSGTNTPKNETDTTADGGEDDEEKGSTGRGKLDDKTRAQILKDRQKSKKANKRASIAPDANNAIDEENTIQFQW